MKTFDPNAAATKNSGIFGLPYTVQEARLVLLPVPWEATTSYGGGTANAPQAIMQASKQVDLFDYDLGNFYSAGIAMAEESSNVQQWNTLARQHAQKVIAVGGNLDENDFELQSDIQLVNDYSARLNDYVYTQTQHLLQQGKCVGLVGGDHAIPLGAIKAFLEQYPDMGILHFDAHADMRQAYEGFEYSHASIMYNVLTKTSLAKLVQVGIRDFCEEEYEFMSRFPERVAVFYDTAMVEQKLSGISWSDICQQIIAQLPQQVYISFDIDGLDPRFCPHTGTPVPGGLELSEALYLIKQVALSGRRIIGFDLNEIAPGSPPNSPNTQPDTASEWDANVGARLLYKLCGWVLHSS